MSIQDFKTSAEIIADLKKAMKHGNGSLEEYALNLIETQQKFRKAKPQKTYTCVPDAEDDHRFTLVSINTSLPDPVWIMERMVEKYGLPGVNWKVVSSKIDREDGLLKIQCKGYRTQHVKRVAVAKKNRSEVLKAILDSMTKEERREYLK